MLSPFDRKKLKDVVVDSMGRNLTIALFHETNDGRTDIQPVWFLKDWKEVYMELLDPTEWEPAMYLIGDWNHWEQLAERSAVSPFIQQWRKELKIKIRSVAIASLKKQADSPKGTAAAKWLAEHQDETKTTKRQAKQQDIASHEEKMVLEDARRLKSAQ